MTQRNVFGLWVIVGLLCGGAAADNPRAHFADDIWGNNYSKHPHMQFHDGKTYVALSATAQDEPYIWAYDHEAKAWQGPVQVGQNQLPPRDQHGNPSLIVDDEGYIHVWYGGHGRRTPEHVYARSAKPGDISEWLHPGFDTKLTYPMPTVLSDGTVAVLYRRGNHSMPGSDAWLYRFSRDNGQTWSEPRVLVQRMTRSTNADVYCVPSKFPGRDRVAVGVSDEYLQGVKTSGHSTEDLFYFEYDVTEDKIYNVEGEAIDAPNGLSHAQMGEHCRLADYEALGNKSYRISARPVVAEDGTIYVLAPNGDPAGFDRNPGKSYGGLPRIWRWLADEKKWTYADPGRGLNYWLRSVDDKLVNYAGTEDHPHARLVSDDHGGTWRLDAAIDVPRAANKRFGTLYNAARGQFHPDARAILYGRHQTDRRALLWGDSGFCAVAEYAIETGEQQRSISAARRVRPRACLNRSVAGDLTLLDNLEKTAERITR